MAGHAAIMKFVKLIGPFAIYFALVVYCISYLNHPLHNWDVLGYVAAAHSFEEKDPQALHKFTFDQVRKSVSDQTYKALASPPGDEPQAVYRRTMSKNPYAFYEQLQFYQIRPVYTGSIYLLSKLGVNIVYATHLISGIAVVVGIMILYLLCKAFLAGPFVYLAPFFAIVFGALDLVRYSTPDGLAFCAVITSAYLFLKDNKMWLLLLFPIMIGIRTKATPCYLSKRDRQM